MGPEGSLSKRAGFWSGHEGSCEHYGPTALRREASDEHVLLGEAADVKHRRQHLGILTKRAELVAHLGQQHAAWHLRLERDDLPLERRERREAVVRGDSTHVDLLETVGRSTVRR